MPYADMDPGTWARYKIGNDGRTAYINLSIKGDVIDESSQFVRQISLRELTSRDETETSSD